MLYLKVFTLLLITGFVQSAFPQTFTRITTGDIVNDGSYTEGVYWLDYNNDGYLDLFAANIVNQNNLLFINNRNSTFTKITTGAIVTDGGFSYGGCFGDFNNDGYADVYVINGGTNGNMVKFLYMNNGNGTFTRTTTGAVVTDLSGAWGAATADYDNDGKLDIFVSNFNQNNFLYKGNGDGTFTKITSGNIVSDGGGSIGCSWCDYDNDGYRDLFVANANFSSGQANFLYKNNGNGTFTKISSGNIVTDVFNSIGGSWGDYDNDGDFDLFVTNYSGANNNLYRNNGDGTFTKITTGAIVNDGGSSVGAAWGDYDNDGDLDLFVSNDLNENNFLYQNNNDGTFTKITSGDIVNNGGRSNGCVWGDYDNDGDIDLYVANGDQPTSQNNFLYRNEGNSNKWINILCKGTASNKSVIGTRIIVRATINGNAVRQTREIFGQTGYNSQNSLNEEFGLGNASIIDSIIVKWPNGNTETFTNVTTNRFITITENQGISNINNSEVIAPQDFRILQNYPNPFNPATVIRYEIGKSALIKISVFDEKGSKISDLFSGKVNAGLHSINWEPVNQQSGIYFLKIESESYTQTIKMVYVK
ncbi:MAG: FG-GAP-like repeat-containing protein [Ignavibacteria bacterium]|nr:FG-GAP-like repeat-containing protein [Ignavibacteria bacterium]